MIIFDWRRREPRDLHEERWPSVLSASLRERYDPAPASHEVEARGRGLWQDLVDHLLRELGHMPEGPALEKACLVALDFFLDQVAGLMLPPEKKPTRVFISHQRADAARGERVACLAEHHGLACWLDVHDPTLALVNRLPANDPRRSLLIAAIVEIALLNCSHVIALHTSSSRSSRWVPYELGRAKAHRIVSRQAAGWFQQGQTVAGCGDYVQLAVMTHDEIEIGAWLEKDAGGRAGNVPFGKDCTVCTPTTRVLT